jgi:hypothetical protein
MGRALDRDRDQRLGRGALARLAPYQAIEAAMREQEQTGSVVAFRPKSA